ncbi:MAG TPA: hypothetical protein VG097_08480 [Gemmata sp.]|nr:hypothetical protein [Gemmata sp.]
MASTQSAESPGLYELLVGDGRPLLAVAALVLIFAGVFALFIAVRGEFLPHDVAFLEMTAPELCAVHGCRIVHFMVHDRVSFGGALIAVGIVYLWLIAGPMSRGERWSWEILTASSCVGFASFLTYLGYGYLDTWHGAATTILAPLYLAGLIITRKRIARIAFEAQWISRPNWLTTPRDRQCLARSLLLFVALGMVGGGLTIATVGMTCVFVPQDLTFLNVQRTELEVLNPRLVPLIAHDRAGFGGAVCCCGVVLAGVVWRATLDRAARQAIAIAGAFGFGTAILVHPAIGYNDLWHLTPAIAGAIIFGLCMWLLQPE